MRSSPALFTTIRQRVAPLAGSRVTVPVPESRTRRPSRASTTTSSVVSAEIRTRTLPRAVPQVVPG